MRRRDKPRMSDFLVGIGAWMPGKLKKPQSP
jgi:hypothetical protein